jgi:hypothetical protein
MRGKSARVGSGFVAESPTSLFPPFQLPTRSKVSLGQLQLFRDVQVQYGLSMEDDISVA